MTLRLYVESPLHAGQALGLPPGPARHVQVRRLQPGDTVLLFDGRGGEWRARVQQMGRQQVVVAVEAHEAVDREARPAVTLAVGMPAGERMDWLVEKATELGAAAVQPLVTERSVLRLDGERAERKRVHWQAVAVAAAEQCGRTRVPVVHAPAALAAWLGAAATGLQGYVLCVPPGARGESVASGAGHAGDAGSAGGAPAAGVAGGAGGGTGGSGGSGAAAVTVLSGPEGGLTPQEERLAQTHRLRPWSFGPRVLRAETAPLAALVLLTLGGAG